MPDITEKLGLSLPLSNETFNRTAYRQNLQLIDQNAAAQTQVDAHLNDFTLQVPFGGTTTNSGNDYTIALPTISTLSSGMAIAIKINADSTGASTLNWDGKGAKAIKKANGSDVTNLKANGIYTLRYDGTNFILQGEGASGDATASDLLSGKKATTDAGEITGTMVNRSGDTACISSTTSGTTLKLKASEGYRDGTDDYVTITDANFMAENIKKNLQLFGKEGALIPAPTIFYEKEVVAGYDGNLVVGSVLNEYVILKSLTGKGRITLIPYSSGSGTTYLRFTIDGVQKTPILIGNGLTNRVLQASDNSNTINPSNFNPIDLFFSYEFETSIVIEMSQTYNYGAALQCYYEYVPIDANMTTEQKELYFRSGTTRKYIGSLNIGSTTSQFVTALTLTGKGKVSIMPYGGSGTNLLKIIKDGVTSSNIAAPNEFNKLLIQNGAGYTTVSIPGTTCITRLPIPIYFEEGIEIQLYQTSGGSCTAILAYEYIPE